MGRIAKLTPALLAAAAAGGALWLFGRFVLPLLAPFLAAFALAAASELMQRYGPDSLIGRTAAVMLGSSETSFYVIAVYFSAAGARDNGRALPAALCADVACFLGAAWISRLLWG